jgi:hypothetical protein
MIPSTSLGGRSSYDYPSQVGSSIDMVVVDRIRITVVVRPVPLIDNSPEWFALVNARPEAFMLLQDAIT